MKPKFHDLAKVRVIDPAQPPAEGFVIRSLQCEDTWLYKISTPDPDNPGSTFDNWFEEKALERVP